MDKKWRGLPCLKTQNRSGVDSDHIAIDYNVNKRLSTCCFFYYQEFFKEGIDTPLASEIKIQK